MRLFGVLDIADMARLPAALLLLLAGSAQLCAAAGQHDETLMPQIDPETYRMACPDYRRYAMQKQ